METMTSCPECGCVQYVHLADDDNGGEMMMNKDIFLRNANYRIDVENWEDKKDEIIKKSERRF